LTRTIVRFAPGRVNLIGEHTDYSGGLVLPVAIDLGVTTSGRATPAQIRLHSVSEGTSVELAADGTSQGEIAGWGRYVSAVAQLLAERGRPPVGVDGEIDSTLPIGAGLASSAALLVSVATALCEAADFELSGLELARLAQAAEQLAVGVPCGLMDPAVAILARRGHALFLDCGSGEYRAVPLPSDLSIVVLDSGVRHRLEESGYATRRDELERALTAIGRETARGLTVSEADALAERAELGEPERRRLRHVVSENERVRQCVAALADGGASLYAELGRIFRAGHESLRDDYEVSTPELDLLVELAYDEGAVAARMTGGGFGGAVVALVDVDAAASFAAAVATAYVERTGITSRTFICSAVDGARTVATAVA
jgi:galactokinase